jgi:hypothetical protein
MRRPPRRWLRIAPPCEPRFGTVVVIPVALDWISRDLVDVGHCDSEGSHAQGVFLVGRLKDGRRVSTAPPRHFLTLRDLTVAPCVLLTQSHAVANQPVVVCPALSRPHCGRVVDVGHAVRWNETRMRDSLRQPLFQPLPPQFCRGLQHPLPTHPVSSAQELVGLKHHLHDVLIAHVLSRSDWVLVQMEDVHRSHRGHEG